MLNRMMAAGLVLCLTGAQATAAASRADVPIGQIVLPNGDTRYFVPVTVGAGAPIDALLDTGSFGLRVLKRALKPDQYEASGVRRSHPFASGSRFSGFMAKASVAVGPLRSERTVTIQVVDKVDCVERKPNCAASKVKPEDFRMAGDGYPAQGFDAILGVSMRKAQVGGGAENPLEAIGDSSWIINLPLPGADAPGHLIINPTPEERAAFNSVQLAPQPLEGWMDGALSGCLVDEASTQRFCGKTLIDTGAPGFSVDSPEATARAQWQHGTPVKFELEGGQRPVEMSFTTGSDWAKQVAVHPPHNPEVTRISAGILAFFFYAVIYDAMAGLIGFQRRSTEP